MAIYDERICSTHGLTKHRQSPSHPAWRCVKCSTEYRVRNRQKKKVELVAENGGRCQVCGYDRCMAALEFHHLDPATKEFGISGNPNKYGIERLRAEIAKCVLLCSNCHAEIEVGFTHIGE